MNPGAAPGWAVLRESRSVNIGTFHAYSENPHVDEYGHPLMEWVQAPPRWADLCLPSRSGDAFQLCLKRIPCDPKRNRLPALRRPRARASPGVRRWSTNILFVGRLDERKGFRYLLQAYAPIKQAIPYARLLVVGAFGEQEQAAFVDYAGANNLSDVHFIGRVSPEDLARYYRTATLFCAPSTAVRALESSCSKPWRLVCPSSLPTLRIPQCHERQS